jgi:hypothetical protein
MSEPTAGQTTREDMNLVRQMAGLSNLRSIILLVCDEFQFDRTPLIDVMLE